ncbi:hypothetical protein VW29_06215 [Devosia limi DSM 17137]|uniref:DNA-binding transcriptional regulator, GntR family n=1 Tax=Devosia limi DSM 17137 TaxID=1121477 RepID=A0A0F5LVN8_9HYPH|nr:GntR family transcriptional regulator [Devosia limi]KKB85707.1 hypothetical protein VW29_06215 [Devosia limi DSM 17137]SHF97392.1 DNA-binding transcriptional regulator, GntR family [Devosia limi DSM 17137]
MSDISPASGAKFSGANLVQCLEDDILSGLLRPGDRLDEQALARRFSVSRTPVREALRSVAASGLLEIRKNHGATVRRLTVTELTEMFEVVAALEGLSARLSARRMSAPECREMRERHDECASLAERGDAEGFFAANEAFHDAIFQASRNEFLQAESRRLRYGINIYRRYITTQPQMRTSVVEHARIVEAIEAGNDEVANILMRNHVDLLTAASADVLLALNTDCIRPG